MVKLSNGNFLFSSEDEEKTLSGNLINLEIAYRLNKHKEKESKKNARKKKILPVDVEMDTEDDDDDSDLDINNNKPNNIIEGKFTEITEEKKSPFTKTDDNTFVFVDGNPVPVNSLAEEDFVVTDNKDIDYPTTSTTIEDEKERKKVLNKIKNFVKNNISNFSSYYFEENNMTKMITLIVVRPNNYNENYLIDPCGLCWGQGTEPRISVNIDNTGNWTFVPMTMTEPLKRALASKWNCLTPAEYKEISEKFIPANYYTYVDFHNVEHINNKEEFLNNLNKVLSFAIEDNRNDKDCNAYPRLRLIYRDDNDFTLVSDERCLSPLPGIMSTIIKKGLRYDYNNETVVKSYVEEL